MARGMRVVRLGQPAKARSSFPSPQSLKLKP